MKSLLSFCLCLFFLSAGLAQDGKFATFFKDARYGIKGGLNIANQFGDLNGDHGFRFDGHLGGFILVPINEKWDGMGEIIYSREGFNWTSDVGDNIGAPLQGYLNMNALASRRLEGRFTADFGIAIAVFLHENTKNVEKSRYKPVWFGITGGTTYTLNDNWLLQARINVKPSDIIRADAGDTEGTSSLVLQLSAVYILN